MKARLFLQGPKHEKMNCPGGNACNDCQQWMEEIIEKIKPSVEAAVGCFWSELERRIIGLKRPDVGDLDDFYSTTRPSTMWSARSVSHCPRSTRTKPAVASRLFVGSNNDLERKPQRRSPRLRDTLD